VFISRISTWGFEQHPDDQVAFEVHRESHHRDDIMRWIFALFVGSSRNRAGTGTALENASRFNSHRQVALMSQESPVREWKLGFSYEQNVSAFQDELVFWTFVSNEPP
jgi:hypothetical protein